MSLSRRNTGESVSSSETSTDTSDLGNESPLYETPRSTQTGFQVNHSKSSNSSTNTSDSGNETSRCKTPRSTKVTFQVDDSKGPNSSPVTSDSGNETPRSKTPQLTKPNFQVDDSKESGIADVSWISSFSPNRDDAFKGTSTPKSCEKPVPRNALRFDSSSTSNDAKIISNETRSARPSSGSSLSLSDISDIANDTPEMTRKRKEKLFSPKIKAETVAKEKKKLQKELMEENNRTLKIYSVTAKEWNQQRFEDEKDTIVSTLKKKLIVKELTRLDQYESPVDCVNVTSLTISNIKYHITLPPTHRYYFCLLTHKATVLASQIVCGSTSKKITFKDDFKFTDLCKDFKVYMRLYQINLPTIRKKLIPRLLSFLRIRRYEKLPKKFQLVSVAAITETNIYKGQIRAAHDIPPGKVSISAKVTGQFGLIPKMFNAHVDFASANESEKILWTRKRCVLDHTALKMRNSSQGEDQPEVVIDILPNIIVARAKQAGCSRKTTLRITTRSDDETSLEPMLQYLIRLATEEDCDGLLRDIELAICVAKQNENIMVKTTRRY